MTLLGSQPLFIALRRCQDLRAELAAHLQWEVESELESTPAQPAASDNAALAAARARIAKLEEQLAAAETLAHKHVTERDAAVLIRGDALDRAAKAEAERDRAQRETERLQRENARLRERLADEPPETEQAPEPPETEQAPEPRGRAVEGM